MTVSYDQKVFGPINPERIVQLRLIGKERTGVEPMLSYGAGFRTTDNYGELLAKQLPVIIFDIGPMDDPERSRFDVDVEMARTIVKRLNGWIEQIDGLASSKVSDQP